VPLAGPGPAVFTFGHLPRVRTLCRGCVPYQCHEARTHAERPERGAWGDTVNAGLTWLVEAQNLWMQATALRTCDAMDTGRVLDRLLRLG
jgi:hypothetical protein